MNRIHALSKGVPRRINLICERALMAACVDGETSVSQKHLVRAIQSIEGQEDRISMIPNWLYPALGGALVLLAVLWFALSDKQEAPAPVPPPVQEQVAAVEKPAVPSPQPVDPVPIASTDIQANARALEEAVPVEEDPVNKILEKASASSPEPAAPAPVIQEQVVAIQQPEDPVPQTAVSQSSFDSLNDNRQQSSMPTESSIQQSESITQSPAPSTQDLVPPAPLPENGFYLAVDHGSSTARLWQGSASGPVVLHDFPLDWRMMEGLYILGNDTDRGAFIFNPVLFEWGGYSMLNATAIWDQVSQYVTGSILPVIVYSGNAIDSYAPDADIPVINEAIGSWARSWQERDIARLMSFYGNTFTSYSLENEQPQKYSKYELADIRGRLLAINANISLKTSSPVCLTDPNNPDLAIAVFRQEYTSNTYADKGTKVLFLQRDAISADRPWKIVAKFFLPEGEG
jgi:hypothetical protein